jgi:phospholipid/cholesterol/gamma-HCH transport system permease protein
MKELLAMIFAPVTGMLQDLGRFTIFVVESVLWFFKPPFRWRLLLDEIEFVGNQSIFIVCLTAIFTGAVFAYQAWLAFVLVGTDTLVGASVAIALTRELAPVLTGIVVAGRAGAAMAAKIGFMQVSEQVDALEVMAVSPMQYLIAPRIVASMIATPLLVGIFSLIGNVGGYLVGVVVCNIDSGIYLQKLKYYLDPMDFYHGLLKGIFFGFILAAIGCYKGYKTTHGAEGVGKATNEAVVYAIVTILVSDYFLSVVIPTGYRSQ